MKALVLTTIVGLLMVTGACVDDADRTDERSTTTDPVGVTSTSTATTIPPVYDVVITTVTEADLGSSWRDGCPVPPEQLRSIDLTHWGFDGTVHRGELVVAVHLADSVVAVFAELFAARYPIERIEPIDVYGGDDQASMAVNNTSGFNCRTVAGSDRLSEHAFGRAIDLNPLYNPYVRSDGRVDPVLGTPYADRTRTDPGLIHDGDATVSAFAAEGWQWGGHWPSGPDYQHFSTSGR